MNAPRKPAVFRIEPELDHSDTSSPRPAKVAERRSPRAIKADIGVLTPTEIDIFDMPDDDLALPPPVQEMPRRSIWLRLFLGAMGILISLAIGIWTDALIRTLFARADWLGWAALGVAAVALLSLVVIIGREVVSLARLASVEKLRQRAEDAIARDDPIRARSVVDELSAFVAGKPETAAGRKLLEAQRGEIVDGGDLICLAETEILAPLDAVARKMVVDAAKRVSLVTAVSPRAVVDVLYVIYEATKLIRGLAALYGGRPGTLGLFRLARNVLAHLAVTGSIAVGDSFVQQIVGHGLAARLSAKLGEGVVNGMMTARIGIAAMETARPLPFNAVKRPSMRDFLAILTRLATSSADAKK